MLVEAREWQVCENMILRKYLSLEELRVLGSEGDYMTKV
jgi:hypothetical protein